jgi:hypothetical protein
LGHIDSSISFSTGDGGDIPSLLSLLQILVQGQKRI